MAKRDPDLHRAWLLGKTFNSICERYDITEVAYALAWVLVTRIVGDWTLLELVGPMRGEEQIMADPSSLAQECPWERRPASPPRK